MRKIASLYLLVILIIIPCYSYDFEVDGLCYNIISNNQVEVTDNQYNDQGYYGTLDIPEKVQYGGKEYFVDAIGNFAFNSCSNEPVPNAILRTFNYKVEEELPEAVCTVNEGEICAFFEAPASWLLIYCWAWNDSPREIFTYANAGWPGVACELLGVAENGNKVWKWTWDGTKQNNTSVAKPGMIIFSNHGAPQTADLTFQNGGYYNEKGLLKTIPVTTYTLSITASGNGSASYSGTTIRSKTSSFTVNAGTSATITFSPDNGYRIKSVKVNNTTVSVSNNQYTISSINANTSVSVEFEAIPVTTYTLSITASGNGSASYNGTTIRNQTSSFALNQGATATISFTPDDGYQIKSVRENGEIVSVSNDQYVVSTISQNTTIEVVYTKNTTTNKFEVDGLCYNILSDNQVEVTYKNENGNSYSGTVVIPEKVKYDGIDYSVIAIGKSAFYWCKELTGSLSLPNSIKTIGDYAFQGCNNLTGSLVLPNSLTSIGLHAFDGCSGFRGSLIIPNTVTSIGRHAFAGCSGLTGSLVIPQSITSISDCAFANCSGFTGILTIPNSVTSIGYGAFLSCSGFTGTLTIPNSVKSISGYAFAYCKSFTGSLVIPTNIQTIEVFSFAGCEGLNGSLIIPNHVTTISQSAFMGCSGIDGKLTIPNSVISIGKYAFQNCSSLAIVESQIDNPYNIDNSVFYFISSSAKLFVPKGCKSKYEALSGWITNFKEIVEVGTATTYTLTISSSGNGSASYSGTTIRSKTSSFILNEGTSATITFSPDNGYRIKSVKVNNSAVSVSNNQYTISSISANTTVSVEFEAIPVTTYTLSIKVSGNGSATYDGTAIREETKTFTVAEGANATITISPDDGYKVNITKIGGNHSSNLNNNVLTFSNIKNNLTVELEFLAIPTYTLSIKSTGNGSASYNGTTIRNKTSNFMLYQGKSATISFSPDNGYRIKSVKENNTVVTSYVSNGIYTINSLSRNTTVEVEFEEFLQAFSADDVNYMVVSVDERTIRLAKGSYGITLEVPAKVNYQNAEWTVTGIDNGALANNPDLAAVVWNPDVAFTEQVSNPNLLLYVNQTQFAPSSIKNVVVNGNATSITLTDAASGNNFHCPQTFTAQKISYTHNYSMNTGIGKAQGWETIALPFDVQKVTHQSKGEIISFANWKSGDATKPFWLMQLSGSGWTMATSIKANTPYIISMPKNDEYKAGFWLDGRVTFSAENVYVAKTENLSIANYSDRTFVPTFTSLEKSNDVFALNVVNDIERNSGGATEGSSFERNLRVVHPFEAYMTSTSSARSIGIDEGMATGIIELISALSDKGDLRIYNLNGQLIKIEEGRSLEEVMKNLPAGIYIVNGKKMIVR